MLIFFSFNEYVFLKDWKNNLCLFVFKNDLPRRWMMFEINRRSPFMISTYGCFALSLILCLVTSVVPRFLTTRRVALCFVASNLVLRIRIRPKKFHKTTNKCNFLKFNLKILIKRKKLWIKQNNLNFNKTNYKKFLLKRENLTF